MQDHRVRLPGGEEVSAVLYRAPEPKLEAGFVFAHGAGSGQQSPFIQDFAAELANRGIDVFTFNFRQPERQG
jgi:predicted alpha/beta-hydrolase family hydrolase